MMPTKRQDVPAPNQPRNCGDCGARPGQPHEGGCDVERCVRCGLQAITCDCIYVENGLDPATLERKHPAIYENGPTPAMVVKFTEEETKLGGPLPWTGTWPGEVECREFGWWSRMTKDGWRTCDPGDEGAGPDLNRYASACAGMEPGFRWDVTARRLVRVQ